MYRLAQDRRVTSRSCRTPRACGSFVWPLLRLGVRALCRRRRRSVPSIEDCPWLRLSSCTRAQLPVEALQQAKLSINDMPMGRILTRKHNFLLQVI
ncbi:hypothetical protein V5799_007555 [Amblyomma americanum]|uniref:Uncharacterized protein n=1 Tax=Amblyomma americanum TaxID=6943 RepID=A0AAQ4FH23_AMBAM